MKKKEYETFMNVLEKTTDELIKKYKKAKKEDAQSYYRQYFTGWDDGAISICELIKEQIERLKEGKYKFKINETMKKEFKAVIQTEKDVIIIFFDNFDIYLDIELAYKGVSHNLYRRINGRYIPITK